MSKKFKGIRRRVEGDRAQHALSSVANQGLTVSEHYRLKDDIGYYIRTKEGPVISLFDTGTITVTGNNRYLVRDREALRHPDKVRAVLIVAVNDDETLLRLGMNLQASGIAIDTTFYSDSQWMQQVGLARKRGQHVLVLVNGSVDETSTSVPSDVYFGLGLIVARIPREHLTLVWDESVAYPSAKHLFDAVLIQYQANIESVNQPLISVLVGADPNLDLGLDTPSAA